MKSIKPQKIATLLVIANLFASEAIAVGLSKGIYQETITGVTL